MAALGISRNGPETLSAAPSPGKLPRSDRTIRWSMSLIMARMPMVQKFRSVLVLISEQRPGQSPRSETSSEDHSMLKRFLTMAACVAALATPAAAHTVQAGSDIVTPVFEHTIPNIPGKNLVSVVVDYPPGGRTEPHLHAKSAFIYAHVLSGAIR